MYYIGTKNQVDYYNDKVEEGENYNGVTKRWANPIKHPDQELWAIKKHSTYDHSNMNLVEQLSDDWFANEII